MLTVIPQEVVIENRIGRVVFEKDWLRAYPSLMEAMSDELYVRDALNTAGQDEVVVVAWCDKFEPVKDARIPKYEFDFVEWKNSGRVLFKQVPGFDMLAKVNGGQ